MRRKRCVTPIAARAGLSWIEVFVVLVVLILLAELIVPSIFWSHRVADRVTCQNNMKILVTATLNWSARSDGQLPDLYEDFTSKSGQTARVPWTMSLLADLDNRNIRRAFEASPREIAESTLSLKSMACPVDTNNFGVAGGLSYVVNTGFIREDIYARNATQWPFAHSLDAIDWNRDGEITDADRQIARSTGCFWPPQSMTDGKPEATRWRRSVTLDFISSGDGQAHTILLSENLQARNWNRADAIHDFAFGVPVTRDRDYDDSVDACLNPRPAYEWILREHGAMPRMNREAKPGTAPRPSSNHLGICIYGFADGSAKQISDSIDWQVYLRLLTPNGQRYGQSAPTTGCDSY